MLVPAEVHDKEAFAKEMRFIPPLQCLIRKSIDTGIFTPWAVIIMIIPLFQIHRLASEGTEGYRASGKSHR